MLNIRPSFCNFGVSHVLFFFIFPVLFSEIIVNINENIKKKNVHLTEDLETLTEAVAVEKLPAEELGKVPQVNNEEETCFGGEPSMVQLTEEERNTHQVRWETYCGDSSEDEDSTPAAVKMPTQEDKVKYMKIDEVSWAKIKS